MTFTTILQQIILFSFELPNLLTQRKNMISSLTQGFDHFRKCQEVLWRLVHTPQVGENGNTELHIAINQNELAHARTLLLNGADPCTTNDGGYDALNFLQYADTCFTQDKIDVCALLLANPRTQNRVNTYLHQHLLPHDQKIYDKIIQKKQEFEGQNKVLDSEEPQNIPKEVIALEQPHSESESPGMILANKVIVIGDSNDNNAKVQQTIKKIFSDLGKIPEFALLLKIAANATLGYSPHCHNELKIFCLADQDRIRDRTLGEYVPRIKMLHFAGQRDEQTLRGTIIHEITHFVAHEVFRNDANPYYSDEKGRIDREIFQKIENNLSKLDDTAARVAEASLLRAILIEDIKLYRDPKVIHSELIARIPQLISWGVYSPRVCRQRPADDTLTTDEIYIYLNSHTEKPELEYAFKDPTGKISREPLKPLLSLNDLITRLKDVEIKSKIELTPLEILITHHFFNDEKQIVVEEYALVDETFGKLKKYYEENFLPHCAEYLRKYSEETHVEALTESLRKLDF